MVYAKDVTELVGATPLVRLNKVAGNNATVVAKLEMTNPASSLKDRAALAIIRAAQASGQLKPGGTIVEATSGNTGVALAMVGAALGYHVVIAMPDSMSIERRILMSAYGAHLLLTPAAGGMSAAIEKTQEYLKSHPGAVYANQFANPANPRMHYETTAVELWEATGGEIDIFVAGVGTGGTISGVGKFLKEKNPKIQIIAVEPAESPMLTEGKAGAHSIQGIGANFVPENLDRKIIDEVITVTSDQALSMARALAKKEGLLVGFSSGAATSAAANLANRKENAGKLIATVLPDTGERYLSTLLFEDLRKNNKTA